METRIDEIAPEIYRLSTYVPEVGPPAGFTFNQFLILDDEPLLFHCGLRRLFPLIRDAVARVMPPERLRWISFGHFEADECGAMNDWLRTAPQATVVHGLTGCSVSINDTADREPRVLADGEVLALGSKRVRYLDTPHVPHGWDAGLIYEETGGTLFCGDLFTHLGDGPAVTSGDILGPAIAAEDAFHSTSLGPPIAPTIRRLAGLEPRRLALMHGSSYEGEGAGALLRGLADAYDERLAAATS